MVILKSTEIKNKKDGIEKAAERLDRKIADLNDGFDKVNSLIQEKTEKKRDIIKRIEITIDKLKKETSSNTEECITALLTLKEELEQDINSYPALLIPQIEPISSLNIENTIKSVYDIV